MANTVKNPPAMRETWVRSLGREDSLEKRMATHSSIMDWRIPWTEEPGGPQSMGSQRVGYMSDWLIYIYYPWIILILYILNKAWCNLKNTGNEFQSVLSSTCYMTLAKSPELSEAQFLRLLWDWDKGFVKGNRKKWLLINNSICLVNNTTLVEISF